MLFSDYLEYHTDTTVRFVATLTRTMAVECDKVGYHKKFKLEGSIATSNLVRCDYMFDCLCVSLSVWSHVQTVTKYEPLSNIIT